MTRPGRISRIATPLAMLWVVCGIVALAVHGGIAVAVAKWSMPDEPSGASDAILIELAPISTESAAAQTSLSVAPPEQAQPEQAPPEKVQPEREDQQEPEKIERQPPEHAVEPPVPEPPPPAKVEVILPRETPPVKKSTPKKVKLATATDRAEHVAPRRAATAGIPSDNPNVTLSYGTSIIRPHLQRFARSTEESGVVVLSFTISRQGRLLSRHIARSSGHAALDNEALATLSRAQPFPPPPPSMTGQQFAFTLPLRYNMR